VFADQLGHFKHGDGFLAAEDILQRVVGVDVGAFLLILQAIFLDVGPQLLRHFRAWDRLAADDQGEFGVGLYRLHERRVGFSFLFRCGFLFRGRFLFRCCHSFSSLRK